jgi:hypothetical protein
MKRIISLLAVMAIMAAMVAASAMPAFAAPPTYTCSQEGYVTAPEVSKKSYYTKRGYTCVKNS